MTTQKITNHLRFRKWINLIERKLVFLGGVFTRAAVIPLIYIVFCRWLIGETIEKETGRIIVSVLSAIAMLVMLRLLLDVYKRNDNSPEQRFRRKRILVRAEMTGLFFSMIAVGVFVFGGVSAVLYKFGMAAYESQKPITVLALNDLYFWHTLDLIPALDICDTFNFDEPMTPDNPGSSTLLILFKMFFLFVILKEIKAWRDRVKKTNRLVIKRKDLNPGYWKIF
jgi:hypothetical protein